MDNKNIHITFSSDDLAVPEVHVEEESILTDENSAEADKCESLGVKAGEKNEPEAGKVQKESLTGTVDEDETDKDGNKKEQHKIKTHIQYDTLAIPEVSIEVDE